MTLSQNPEYIEYVYFMLSNIFWTMVTKRI